jgi:hypothetical protein
MKSRILVLFAGVALLAEADWVFAHHSFSATYDSAQKVEIEGVVKEFVWRNPHSFMRIDVTDKDGTTKTWALEWGSASQLAQSQIARTTLRPGDRLIVSGEPARDPSSLRLLIQTLKRPADGWSWQGRVE